MAEGIYVYGIADKNGEAEFGGTLSIDGVHPIIWNKTDDFYVVTSYVGLGEFGADVIDKKLEDMVWVEEKVRRHFDIVNKVSESGTTIPMKFCTIYENRENLQNFIDQYTEQIKKALVFFKDKEEWTLKVYCNKKDFVKYNMEEERKEMQENTAGISKGAAYFMEKKLASTLGEKAKYKIAKIKDGFWDQIKVYAEQSKINKNLSNQVTEKEHEMILNAAFLIKKDKLGEFIKELETQETQLGSYNISFEFAGPWPFYNFSYIFLS